MQARSGGQGRARVAVEQVLAHGDGRAQALDGAHPRRGEAQGARSQRVDLQEAPARLVVDDVEHQRRLARPGDARHHRQPVSELNVDIA